MAPERDADGFGAGGGAELLEDGGQLTLGGDGRDAELAADLLVGESAHDRFEDLHLTFRKRRQRLFVEDALKFRREGRAAGFEFAHKADGVYIRSLKAIAR